MMTTRETGPEPALDAAQVLDAVGASLRALVAAAPWPRALASTALDVLSEPTRVLGGYLTTWALLPLCCCAATCGAWRPALRAATAAELCHAASDIFDDLEDGDASPIIDGHGAPIALNLATALLALMHKALEPATAEKAEGGRRKAEEDQLPAPDSRLPPESVACRRAQDALWAGIAVATGGQHLDLTTAGAAPLAVEDCLDIARRKGGALAEACCRAGAACGTADPALIERFGLVGRSIGLVGQLDNDLHDAGNGALTSDLAQRKQTVPIAVARAVRTSEPLGAAVWRGGIQMAYALVHTERARAGEALEAAAAACPDPAFARAVLAPVLLPRGQATP